MYINGIRLWLRCASLGWRTQTSSDFENLSLRPNHNTSRTSVLSDIYTKIYLKLSKTLLWVKQDLFLAVKVQVMYLFVFFSHFPPFISEHRLWVHIRNASMVILTRIHNLCFWIWHKKIYTPAHPLSLGKSWVYKGILFMDTLSWWKIGLKLEKVPWEAHIPPAGSHQAPFPTPYLNNPAHAHPWHWTSHHQRKTVPLSSTF